jgi:hypothetical protein
MALDLLLIPAISADQERLFSGLKLTITDRRSKLGILVVQVLECIKSWIGLIKTKGDGDND